MNRIKEIAARIIEDDEFTEEIIRNAVERAALRELIEDERIHANSGSCMAALDIQKQRSMESLACNHPEVDIY